MLKKLPSILITIFFILVSTQSIAFSYKFRKNISRRFFDQTIIPYSKTINSSFYKMLGSKNGEVNKKTIIRLTQNIHRKDLYMNFFFDVVRPLRYLIRKNSLKDLRKLPVEKINFRINEMSMIFSQDDRIPRKNKQQIKRLHGLWNIVLMNSLDQS